MTFFVYILGNYRRSKLTTYVGYTNNLGKRLRLHNEGKGAKFTKGRIWKILYKEKYLTSVISLSKLFNKEGIVLVDSRHQKYICGELTNKEKPLTLKL